MNDRETACNPLSHDPLSTDSPSTEAAVTSLWVRLMCLAEVNPQWSGLLSSLIASRKEVERFLKFLVVGTVGAVVDFGILNLLVLLFGLAKVWANACSFSAAVCSNFMWNRLWTYPETQDDPVLPQVTQFALVNVIGLGINQAIFLSLDRWAFPNWGPLGYNLAKVIATGVVLFWNFGANRLWTYRHI